MATGHTIEEVRRLIPTVFEHFEKYKQQLKDRNIPLELAFAKRRSKDFNEYQINRKTAENNAMKQLNTEGKSLVGGQILRYVSANTKSIAVVTPLELVDNNTLYDIERYTTLLAQTCNSVIEPFR